jgi:hypothetical protein
MFLKEPLKVILSMGVGTLLVLPTIRSRTDRPVDQSTVERQGGEYVAYSLLQIAYREPQTVTKGEAEPARNTQEFDTYRRTQMQLIRSPSVMAAALRAPEVSGLRLVKQHPDSSVQWLAAAIEVSSPDNCEIVRVALRGDDPVELKALVEAVTNAYIKEVVDADRAAREGRVLRLRQAYAALAEKCSALKNQRRDVSALIGTAATAEQEVQQRIELEHAAFLQRELTRVSLELVKAQLDRPVQESAALANEAEVSDAAVADQVDRDAAIGQLREHIANVQRTMESAAKVQKDPENSLRARLEKELDSAQKSLEARRAEVAEAVHAKLRAAAAHQARAVAKQSEHASAVLSAQQGALQSELDALRARMEKRAQLAIEVQRIDDDLAQTTRSLNMVRDRVDTLALELETPPRVTRLEGAGSAQAVAP